MSLLDGLGSFFQGPLNWVTGKPSSPGSPPTESLPQRIADSLELAHQHVELGLSDLVDRVRSTKPPQGPFPSMASLQAKFPEAGLPDRMVGTTIDNQLLNQPGTDPDQLMAKVAAMGFNTVRLGAYWDEMQAKGPGETDFSKLQALLDAAERHHVRVVLTVGAKGPNWPEFHVPKWAEPPAGRHPSNDATFRGRSEAFVRAVAEHFKDHPAIAMWQVENEPFDPSGPKQRDLSTSMVSDEIQILRQADGHRRPVMINCWSDGDRKGQIDHAFALADLVGLDVYRNTGGAGPLGSEARTTAIPAYALELAKKTGKPAVIAELQADDWGRYRANGQDVTDLTHHLERMGYENVLFWRLDQNVADEKKGDDGLTRTETRLAEELRNGRSNRD
jgi:hypothetical protein